MLRIIKLVEPENEKTPHSFWKRLGWFAILWSGSTAVVLGASSLLHMLIPH
ncbi:DUF2474 domain-containing protein [Acetobacteraceae bacterium ESL0709]|nr:DUF2474 domain-containing protein [Acetobacteraceae bacterium ESL0697]MDF7678006.1 DUF2474 domain-containing protein [Acetobacteraceae bacterium ESL0709]